MCLEVGFFRMCFCGVFCGPFCAVAILAFCVFPGCVCAEIRFPRGDVGLRGFNIRNWRLSRASGPFCGLRDEEGVGVIAFRPALLSRRYRLHQTERKISQNSGCGINLSADIDVVTLWRDMAIFYSKTRN
jgi:hypothetical protein